MQRGEKVESDNGANLKGDFLSLAVSVCVGCLFLRTPSRAPYRTPPACAKSRSEEILKKRYFLDLLRMS